MSATQNIDSLANQGEFHSRVPGSEPLTHKGHKPGVKVGNDAAPEFSAEKFPPGTAPKEHTFQPDARYEVPGQALNPDMDESTRTSAQDTILGSTSQSVHNATQYGKPLHGQTSSELHGSRKKDRTGVEGRVLPDPTGAKSSVVTGPGSVERKVREVGADLEGRAAELKGQRGKSGAQEGGLNWTGAEELPPTSPEQLADSRRPPGGAW